MHICDQIHNVKDSTTGTNLTPEMLEEFLSLPNNMQNFVEFLQTKKSNTFFFPPRLNGLTDV